MCLPSAKTPKFVARGNRGDSVTRRPSFVVCRPSPVFPMSHSPILSMSCLSGLRVRDNLAHVFDGVVGLRYQMHFCVAGRSALVKIETETS